MKRDRQIGGKCPGSSGPDEDGNMLSFSAGTFPLVQKQRKLNIDRGRRAVHIFDLRFGQRRTAGSTPEHRLFSLVDITDLKKAARKRNDLAFVLRIQGEVGIIPLSEYSQALELLTLNVHKIEGVIFAFLPNSDGRHVVFLSPRALSTLISIGRPWQSQPGR